MCLVFIVTLIRRSLFLITLEQQWNVREKKKRRLLMHIIGVRYQIWSADTTGLVYTQRTQSMNRLSTLQFDLTFLPSPTSYVQSTFRLSMSLTQCWLFARQLIVFSLAPPSHFVCFHFTSSIGLAVVYFLSCTSRSAACVRIDASKKSTWNKLLWIHHHHFVYTSISTTGLIQLGDCYLYSSGCLLDWYNEPYVYVCVCSLFVPILSITEHFMVEIFAYRLWWWCISFALLDFSKWDW